MQPVSEAGLVEATLLDGRIFLWVVLSVVVGVFELDDLRKHSHDRRVLIASLMIAERSTLPGVGAGELEE